MALTSKIIEQTIQSGGTQRVQVAFTDYLGRTHNRSYDFPKDTDVNVEILTRQSHVEQGLKDQEIELVAGRVANRESYKLEYASDVDLKTRLQELETEKQIEIDRLVFEKTNISAEIR